MNKVEPHGNEIFAYEWEIEAERVAERRALGW